MATRDALREQVLSAPWEDLAPHLARGGLLLLAPEVDLLDAAMAIANDDADAVRELLERGVLTKAEAHHAEACAERSTARFQLLIVQPYVIAQRLLRPTAN